MTVDAVHAGRDCEQTPRPDRKRAPTGMNHTMFQTLRRHCWLQGSFHEWRADRGESGDWRYRCVWCGATPLRRLPKQVQRGAQKRWRDTHAKPWDGPEAGRFDYVGPPIRYVYASEQTADQAVDQRDARALGRRGGVFWLGATGSSVPSICADALRQADVHPTLVDDIEHGRPFKLKDAQLLFAALQQLLYEYSAPELGLAEETWGVLESTRDRVAWWLDEHSSARTD